DLLCHRNRNRNRNRKGKHVKILNIADGGSKASVALASGILNQINVPVGTTKRTPQAIGKAFPRYTLEFLRKCFKRLDHIRPGEWTWSDSQVKIGIAAFDQYKHLDRLQKVLSDHPEIKAALGGDYFITPDIVVARQAISDAEINSAEILVHPDSLAASLSPLRRSDKGSSILHASISCKWTMRSDRAQNTRTEALNLIRNRKGKTPHIMVVTFEPLPNRLASIAMGTGDVDCTYHVALHELRHAAENSRFEDQADLLRELIEGRRLRDISDLPLDLAT
ncbi:MAG: NgoMIV family type II restriction endonuclease, partial [Candidatus Binatia bacterium]